VTTVPFLESAAFAAVINQASSWLNTVSARAADDRAKRAAELLFNSGVTVASLRLLDNCFRRVVGDVSQFRVDWPPDRRKVTIDNILEIAHSDVILPELQEAVGYLLREVPTLADPERTPATTILEVGAGVVGYLGREPGHTPFESKQLLTDLLNGLQNATNPIWVDRTIQLSETALDIFDRAALGRATEALGALKHALVTKHHSIAPVPRWTLAAAMVTPN
jgi:hypothetical protein